MEEDSSWAVRVRADPSQALAYTSGNYQGRLHGTLATNAADPGLILDAWFYMLNLLPGSFCDYGFVTDRAWLLSRPPDPALRDAPPTFALGDASDPTAVRVVADHGEYVVVESVHRWELRPARFARLVGLSASLRWFVPSTEMAPVLVEAEVVQGKWAQYAYEIVFDAATPLAEIDIAFGSHRCGILGNTVEACVRQEHLRRTFSRVAPSACWTLSAYRPVFRLLPLRTFGAGTEFNDTSGLRHETEGWFLAWPEARMAKHNTGFGLAHFNHHLPSRLSMLWSEVEFETPNASKNKPVKFARGVRISGSFAFGAFKSIDGNHSMSGRVRTMREFAASYPTTRLLPATAHDLIDGALAAERIPPQPWEAAAGHIEHPHMPVVTLPAGIDLFDPHGAHRGRTLRPLRAVAVPTSESGGPALQFRRCFWAQVGAAAPKILGSYPSYRESKLACRHRPSSHPDLAGWRDACLWDIDPMLGSPVFDPAVLDLPDTHNGLRPSEVRGAIEKLCIDDSFELNPGLTTE